MSLKYIISFITKRLHISYYITLYSKEWLNPFLTAYINLKFLPISQAKKMPIWIYGKTKFMTLGGKFIIDTDKVYSGMILIGKNTGPCSGGVNEIANYSKIIFRGRTEIKSGCKILTYGTGVIIFGENFSMGNQNLISCANQIIIGNNVVLAHQIQIFDTDFHYLYNDLKQCVSNNNKPIIIGDHCWIGNRVSIMKGTELPNYIVIGSNSLLNKKYEISQGSILAGIPAKIVSSSYYMITNIKIEDELFNYFKSGEKIYQFKSDVSLKDLVHG